jgi:hypothetical protein
LKTLCKKLDHIREVHNITPKTSGQLGPYLAGLIESDGALITPKNSSVPLQFIYLYRISKK